MKFGTHKPKTGLFTTEVKPFAITKSSAKLQSSSHQLPVSNVKQENGTGSWKLKFILILVLAIVLSTSLLYYFRTDIWLTSPNARQVLESICEKINCDIGYKDLSKITFEQSTLSQVGSTDKSGNQQLLFQFSLRNYLDQPQRLPFISLSLNDDSNVTLIRKSITPADYEHKKNDFLQPNSSLSFSFSVTTNGNTPIGKYQMRMHSKFPETTEYNTNRIQFDRSKPSPNSSQISHQNDSQASADFDKERSRFLDQERARINAEKEAAENIERERLKGSTPPVKTQGMGNFVVQTASFDTKADAQAQTEKLAPAGFGNAFFDGPVSINGKQKFRVRVGPFPSREAAQSAQTRLRSLGFGSAFITTQ